MRRPAYFSPARRRPPESSQTSAPSTSTRERREQDREAGCAERRPFRIHRQRCGRLVVEPAAHAAEQRARGLEAESRAGHAHDEPRPPVVGAIGYRARRHERAQHEGHGHEGVEQGSALGGVAARAPADEVERRDEDQRAEQERPLLEEAEVGAREVQAHVGRGQRTGEEHREERPDPDRGRDSGALEEVEDEVHAR